MFILRALFWLTVMFIVFAPKDFDLGRKATEAGQTMLTEGTKLAVPKLATDVVTGSVESLIDGALATPAARAKPLASERGDEQVPLPHSRPVRD